MKSAENKHIQFDAQDLEECKYYIEKESYVGRELDTTILKVMGFFIIRKAISEDWCNHQKEY